MMRFIRRFLLSVIYPYANPIDVRRARLLLVLNWGAVSAVVLWLAVIFLPFGGADPATRGGNAVAGLLFVLLCWVTVRLTQTGRLRAARVLFVSMLVVVVSGALLALTPTGLNLSEAITLVLAVPIVAAAVLLDRRGTIIVMLLMVLVTVVMGLGQAQLTEVVSYIPSEAVSFDLPVTALLLVMLAGFLLAATVSIEQIAKRALDDVELRDWITGFGTELAAIEDENALLGRALSAVRERLGYLFVQVALTDDVGVLTRALRAGMGQQDVVPRPLSRLPDSNIMVDAARSQTARIARPTDPSSRRGHMLSASGSAAALPICFGGNTLAVLDVQSAQPNAFDAGDLAVLQLLSDQIGVALNNARQLADFRRSLRDRDTTNTRLESQIQEYRQRERRGVSSVWGSYIQGRGKQSIGFDLAADGLLPADDLPPGIRQTLQQGDLHIEAHGDEQVVHVPIKFRDQTLGAMAFVLPRGQALTEREIDMTRIVSERLALALENTRLFEQSQAQAVRERKASEITSLLIGATDVRAVLNLAADNFREALGAVHTRILIQPDTLVEPLAPAPGGSGEEGSR